MAQQRKGILGPPLGPIGSVTGYSRNGIDIIQARPNGITSEKRFNLKEYNEFLSKWEKFFDLIMFVQMAFKARYPNAPILQPSDIYPYVRDTWTVLNKPYFYTPLIALSPAGTYIKDSGSGVNLNQTSVNNQFINSTKAFVGLSSRRYKLLRYNANNTVSEFNISDVTNGRNVSIPLRTNPTRVLPISLQCITTGPEDIETFHFYQFGGGASTFDLLNN